MIKFFGKLPNKKYLLTTTENKSGYKIWYDEKYFKQWKKWGIKNNGQK
jgi:hypothetical protein